MRHIAGEIERIARLHFVRRSIDNQLHSSGQNVDYLLVRMLVRRHLAPGLECGEHLVHCFPARHRLTFDAGANRDPGILFFHGLAFRSILIRKW